VHSAQTRGGVGKEKNKWHATVLFHGIPTDAHTRPRMMLRVAGKVLGALGMRDAGTGRGRLAHLLPPVVVGLQPSVISPRERERQRWGGALLRPSARHGEVEGLLITTTRT
jgi:hypothetical protein